MFHAFVFTTFGFFLQIILNFVLKPNPTTPPQIALTHPFLTSKHFLKTIFDATVILLSKTALKQCCLTINGVVFLYH